MLDSVAERGRAIHKVLVVTLVLNLVVAAAKVAAGTMFHLVSLTADGLHSGFDGLNNIVGLIALKAAGRPPDAGHPYGHRKFETFATLGIGISLGVVGAGLVREAVIRVQTHTAPTAHPITFAVAALTLVINLFVARYEARRGRALDSEFLLADSQHTRSDVFVTLTVFGALIAVAYGVPAIDLIAAASIAIFIGWTAYQIIAKNLRVLADAVAIDSEQIRSIVGMVNGVQSCHKIRSRGPTGHVFVDLHIQVDSEMTTASSHDLGHRVASAIKRELPSVADVLVHVEPYSSTTTSR